MKVDARTMQPVAVFHQYVQPTVNPHLSPFCTKLTGIIQDMVDGQPSLDAVLRLFDEWLQKEGQRFTAGLNGWLLDWLTDQLMIDRLIDWLIDWLRLNVFRFTVCLPLHCMSFQEMVFLIAGLSDPNVRFSFVTCGDWDLGEMLPQQAKHFRLPLPAYFDNWINLKHAFSESLGHYPRSLMLMLESLGIKHTGRAHSGIDDCKNIVNIVRGLAQRGQIFHTTGQAKNATTASRINRPRWATLKNEIQKKFPYHHSFGRKKRNYTRKKKQLGIFFRKIFFKKIFFSYQFPRC